MITASGLCAQRRHVQYFPVINNVEANSLSNIFASQDGILHFADRHALYSFDGNAATKEVAFPWTMQKGPFGLTSGQQICMIDRSGRVLIYAQSTYNLLDSFSIDKKVDVTNVAMHPDGIVLFSENKIYFLAKDKRDISLVSQIRGEIYDAEIDADGSMWLATDDGLYHVGGVGDNPEIRKYGKKEGLEDEIVFSIARLEGQLYVGTYDAGMFHFNERLRQFNPISLPGINQPIRRLEPQGDGRLWMALASGRVYEVFPRIGSAISVLDDDGNSIVIDEQSHFFQHKDLLWFFDSESTLCKLYKALTWYRLEISSEIQSLLYLGDQQLFVGSSDGAYYLDPETGKSTAVPPLQGKNIISLHQVDDQVLIGTFDQGLFAYSLENHSLISFDHLPELKNNSIIAIETRANKMWLATLGGVYFGEMMSGVKGVEIHSLQRLAGLANDYVYDIEVNDDGDILLATDGSGLARVRGKDVQYFSSKEDGFSHLFSLRSIGTTEAWALESDNGLCHCAFEEAKISCVPATDQEEVSAMLRADDSHVYIFHKNGIDCYDHINGLWLKYGLGQGLEGFTPQLNAVAQSDKNELFVASPSEIIRVVHRPSAGLAPKVKIANVLVEGEAVVMEECADFGARSQTVVFDIDKSYYHSPQPLAIQYRLKGLDDEWRTSADDLIVYARLEPDHYQLEIRPDLPHHLAVADSFSFEIQPPWWERWWINALALLTLAGLIYVWMRVRERELERKQALETAQLERQYEVLKNQLNPHFLFNAFNNLIGYIEVEPKTAVSMVERLSDFYRRILELKETKLIPLKQELNFLEDYIFLLNKRFGDNLQVEVDIDNPSYFIPPMTLQILVENAVKHNKLSPKEPLFVSIKQIDGSKLMIKNRKNLKRSRPHSTGIGLENINKRYALLGLPEITIDSRGEDFVVVISLAKRKKNENTDR